MNSTGGRVANTRWVRFGLDARMLPGLLSFVPPATLLALCRVEPAGPLSAGAAAVAGQTASLVIGAAGAATLTLVPGYALLSAIGALPGRRIPAEGPGLTWAMIVPLSLAIDAMVGTVLVIGPGLSKCNLWSGLAAFVLIAIAGASAARVATRWWGAGR